MKYVLLLALSTLSIAGWATQSKQNKEIDLDDALKTQGTYNVTAHEVIRDAKGNEKRNRITNYGVLVIMYDPGENILIGSFTSKKNNAPSNLVKLSSKYSADRKSLEFAGFGGGSLHGQLNLTIGIDSGELKGTFIDGAALGRREIVGKRESSLGTFANMDDAVYSDNMPMANLVGSYIGIDKGDQYCANPKGCRVHMIVQQFDDKRITASLTFLDHTAMTFNYDNGSYDPYYALVELMWNGQTLTTGLPNLNSRLRTKVNILALKNGQIAVYLYTTTGIHSYFTLSRNPNADVRILKANSL